MDGKLENYNSSDNPILLSFTFRPINNTFLEIINLTLGTSHELILKIDASNCGPAVELIGFGSVGQDAKLHGVRCWHRANSFKHLEWEHLKIQKSAEKVFWIGVDDGPRLAKIIDSFVDLSGMTHDPEKEFCQNIHVTITTHELKMFHEKSASIFTLAVRIFDADWAAELVVIPSTSPPTCAIKMMAVSGIEQIASILKRIDKWRDAWNVDLLTISTKKNYDDSKDYHDSKDFSKDWDLQFTAESSSPPIVNLSVTLPKCPESFTSSRSALRNVESQVSIGLAAALRALIAPLADSKALGGSISGVTWFWIPQEALVCNISWNAIGMGQVSSTIFIPSKIK